jgi:hypothetical protein
MTNALITNNQESRSLGFVDAAVQTFEGIEKLAGVMAKMGTMPAHLAGKPADCFRIVVQAAKWRMDPFAVAECTSLVHGRMCFEGKLIAAVLQSMGAIDGRLSYEISGKGQGASIVVTGTPKGGKAQVLRGSVAEWATKHNGSPWATQPETMLVYRGTRQWARLYVPEALLGVYTPDEFEPEEKMADATVHPAEPEPARTAPAATTVETKPADPPKPDPKPEIHPAMAAANSLYASLQQMEKGLGKEVLELLAKINGASTPREIKPENLEQFGKDVAGIVMLGNNPAAIRSALAEWAATVNGGKP